MTTDLQKQLLSMGGSLPNKAKPLRRCASFLFADNDASAMSPEQIHDIGIRGLRGLTELDRRFARYESILFTADSIQVDRSVLSTEIENVINNNLRSLLVMCSQHFLKTPVSYVLEYIIRIFDAHKYNTEDLLRCALPYSQHILFARLIQLLPLRSIPLWGFLEKNARTGTPVPQRSLIEHINKNEGALLFVNRMIRDSLQHNALGKSATVFWTEISIMLCERDPNERLLRIMLPLVYTGIQGEHYELSSAALLIMIAVNQIVSLNNDVFEDSCRSICESMERIAEYGTRMEEQKNSVCLYFGTLLSLVSARVNPTAASWAQNFWKDIPWSASTPASGSVFSVFLFHNVMQHEALRAKFYRVLKTVLQYSSLTDTTTSTVLMYFLRVGILRLDTVESEEPAHIMTVTLLHNTISLLEASEPVCDMPPQNPAYINLLKTLRARNTTVFDAFVSKAFKEISLEKALSIANALSHAFGDDPRYASISQESAKIPLIWVLEHPNWDLRLASVSVIMQKWKTAANDSQRDVALSLLVNFMYLSFDDEDGAGFMAKLLIEIKSILTAILNNGPDVENVDKVLKGLSCCLSQVESDVVSTTEEPWCSLLATMESVLAEISKNSFSKSESENCDRIRTQKLLLALRINAIKWKDSLLATKADTKNEIFASRLDLDSLNYFSSHLLQALSIEKSWVSTGILKNLQEVVQEAVTSNQEQEMCSNNVLLALILLATALMTNVPDFQKQFECLLSFLRRGFSQLTSLNPHEIRVEPDLSVGLLRCITYGARSHSAKSYAVRLYQNSVYLLLHMIHIGISKDISRKENLMVFDYLALVWHSNFSTESMWISGKGSCPLNIPGKATCFLSDVLTQAREIRAVMLGLSYVLDQEPNKTGPIYLNIEYAVPTFVALYRLQTQPEFYKVVSKASRLSFVEDSSFSKSSVAALKILLTKYAYGLNPTVSAGDKILNDDVDSIMLSSGFSCFLKLLLFRIEKTNAANRTELSNLAETMKSICATVRASFSGQRDLLPFLNPVSEGHMSNKLLYDVSRKGLRKHRNSCLMFFMLCAIDYTSNTVLDAAQVLNEWNEQDSDEANTTTGETFSFDFLVATFMYFFLEHQLQTDKKVLEASEASLEPLLQLLFKMSGEASAEASPFNESHWLHDLRQKMTRGSFLLYVKYNTILEKLFCSWLIRLLHSLDRGKSVCDGLHFLCALLSSHWDGALTDTSRSNQLCPARGAVCGLMQLVSEHLLKDLQRFLVEPKRHEIVEDIQVTTLEVRVFGRCAFGSMWPKDSFSIISKIGLLSINSSLFSEVVQATHKRLEFIRTVQENDATENEYDDHISLDLSCAISHLKDILCLCSQGNLPVENVNYILSSEHGWISPACISSRNLVNFFSHLLILHLQYPDNMTDTVLKNFLAKYDPSVQTEIYSSILDLLVLASGISKTSTEYTVTPKLHKKEIGLVDRKSEEVVYFTVTCLRSLLPLQNQLTVNSMKMLYLSTTRALPLMGIHSTTLSQTILAICSLSAIFEASSIMMNRFDPELHESAFNLLSLAMQPKQSELNGEDSNGAINEKEIWTSTTENAFWELISVVHAKLNESIGKAVDKTEVDAFPELALRVLSLLEKAFYTFSEKCEPSVAPSTLEITRTSNVTTDMLTAVQDLISQDTKIKFRKCYIPLLSSLMLTSASILANTRDPLRLKLTRAYLKIFSSVELCDLCAINVELAQACSLALNITGSYAFNTAILASERSICPLLVFQSFGAYHDDSTIVKERHDFFKLVQRLESRILLKSIVRSLHIILALFSKGDNTVSIENCHLHQAIFLISLLKQTIEKSDSETVTSLKLTNLVQPLFHSVIQIAASMPISDLEFEECVKISNSMYSKLKQSLINAFVATMAKGTALHNEAFLRETLIMHCFALDRRSEPGARDTNSAAVSSGVGDTVMSEQQHEFTVANLRRVQMGLDLIYAILQKFQDVSTTFLVPYLQTISSFLKSTQIENSWLWSCISDLFSLKSSDQKRNRALIESEDEDIRSQMAFFSQSHYQSVYLALQCVISCAQILRRLSQTESGGEYLADTNPELHSDLSTALIHHIMNPAWHLSFILKYLKGVPHDSVKLRFLRKLENGFSTELSEHIVPALDQMALCSGHGKAEIWRELQNSLLKIASNSVQEYQTFSPSLRDLCRIAVQRTVLRVVDNIYQFVGEEMAVLLRDLLNPITNIMEQSDPLVVTQARQLLRSVQKSTGQSLEGFLS